MNKRWTKGIPADKRQQLKDHINSSDLVLDRISQIIEHDIEDLRRRERNLESFKDSNWPCKEAYLIGFEAGLLSIKTLLTREDNND